MGHRAAAHGVLPALLVGACAGPPLLFESRVPIAPLLEKLQAAGGDPAKVMTVRAEGELAGLKPGRRYKYVVTADGSVRVAPRPADESGNEYVHPVLTGGAAVRTAGYLRYERRGATTTYDLVYVDQDSKAYCPTFASLAQARSALVRLGVSRDRVRLEDHPPACVAPPPTAPSLDGAIAPEPPSPSPSPAPPPSP